MELCKLLSCPPWHSFLFAALGADGTFSKQPQIERSYILLSLDTASPGTMHSDEHERIVRNVDGFKGPNQQFASNAGVWRICGDVSSEPENRSLVVISH